MHVDQPVSSLVRAGAQMIFPFLPFMVHDFFPEYSTEDLGRFLSKLPLIRVLARRDPPIFLRSREQDGLPSQRLLPGKLCRQHVLGLAFGQVGTPSSSDAGDWWVCLLGTLIWVQVSPRIA